MLEDTTSLMKKVEEGSSQDENTHRRLVEVYK